MKLIHHFNPVSSTVRQSVRFMSSITSEGRDPNLPLILPCSHAHTPHTHINKVTTVNVLEEVIEVMEVSLELQSLMTLMQR